MQNSNLDLKSGKMSSQGSKDDCYFYFYSSCTKGDDCPFRHCQAALGTETVCCLWREGKCLRDNCKFRHMESRINRGTIQCYWEDQPSGCLKPHCVFLHRRPRFNTNVGNGGLILPVSNTPTQTSPSNKVTEVKDAAKNIAINPVVESYSNNGVDDLTPTYPVEPIVVSFDGEESDSESTSSTPMKSASDSSSRYNSSSPAKKNLAEKNLGIKTLEQIKMEKIHKESDNFYKSAYDEPYIDAVQMKMADVSFKAECYPPQSDFLMISDRPVEKSVCANTESSQHSPENESPFKNRLQKRKSIPLYSEMSLPPKKICLKKNKDDPLDFKIKTLDEIRREKQNKSGNNEETSVQNGAQNTSVVDESHNKAPSIIKNKAESSNINGKSFRRLKINRQTKEAFLNSNNVQEADNSSENQKKDDRSQMILHEVQNITEDQNKTDIKGKRKENDVNSESKSPKQFKSDNASPCSTSLPTSNDSQKKSTVEEKQVNKISRPVIKRKRSTSVLMSSKSASESETSSTIAKNCESSISSSKANNISLKEDKSLSSSKDTDKKTSKSSVDELDSFLMNETDVNLDYESDGALNEPEDILLEIEQLLDS